MPLDEIRDLLGSDDPQEVNRSLKLHRERLAERLAEHERMIATVEALITGDRALRPHVIVVRPLDPIQVVSLTREVDHRTVAEAIASGFGVLAGMLAEARITPASPPFIVFHDIIDEVNPGSIELCIPVAVPIATTPPAEIRTLDGGQAATTTHRGPFDMIAAAYYALADWIVAHGHETAGPPREVYLSDPTYVSDDDLLTEIVWPIKGEESP
jgi:effector-binding domain-containing protein